MGTRNQIRGIVDDSIDAHDIGLKVRMCRRTTTAEFQSESNDTLKNPKRRRRRTRFYKAIQFHRRTPSGWRWTKADEEEAKCARTGILLMFSFIQRAGGWDDYCFYCRKLSISTRRG